MRVQQAVDQGDQARFHVGNRAPRQRAHDQLAHARVQRRVVEHQAGRVVLQQRRAGAVLGRELHLLVGAEGLRVAIHRHEVGIAREEVRAVGHALDRLASRAAARRPDKGWRRSPAAARAGRSRRRSPAPARASSPACRCVMVQEVPEREQHRVGRLRHLADGPRQGHAPDGLAAVLRYADQQLRRFRQCHLVLRAQHEQHRAA